MGDAVVQPLTTPDELIPLLQALQRERGWLSQETLEEVARRLALSVARVRGVACFYAGFHLKPRGRTVVRVCTGTACHVGGAPRVTDALVKALGVAPGETTPDLGHTLETVACLGCCSLAPVITVGEDTHGRVDPRVVPELLTPGEGA